MANKINGKYNSLLVEFDFLIDLDWAIYMYMRDKYPDQFYPEIMNLQSEEDIIKAFLYRDNINPLSIMGPDDYDTLYKELMEPEIKHELISKYSRVYDSFRLMITFLDNASSLYMEILCNDEFEADYIKSKSDRFIIKIANRNEVDLNNYNTILMKYLAYSLLYKDIQRQNIIVANAKYNMQKEYPDIVNITLGNMLISLNNKIHIMDLYKDIKYDPKLILRREDNEQQNTE